MCFRYLTDLVNTANYSKQELLKLWPCYRKRKIFFGWAGFYSSQIEIIRELLLPCSKGKANLMVQLNLAFPRIVYDFAPAEFSPQVDKTFLFGTHVEA